MIISRLACRVVSVRAIVQSQCISYKFGSPDDPKYPPNSSNSKLTQETDPKSPTQNTFSDKGVFNNEKIDSIYERAAETLKNQKNESGGEKQKFEKESVGKN